jgi:hypothetical protein
MYGLALPARFNTLSFVFAMPKSSFPWLACRFLPKGNPRKRALASVAVLIVLLAGCGGGKGAGTGDRSVRGTGYVFSAPSDWTVTRSDQRISAASGLGVVSVTRFPLQHAFRATLWPKVVPELDSAAAAVAAQQKGVVTESRTVTTSGRRARRYDVAYEHDGKKLVERLVFVLREKTEYLLLCRYERGGDTRACELLLATFRLT